MKIGLTRIGVAAVIGAGAMLAPTATAQDLASKGGVVQRYDAHDWTLGAFVSVRPFPERDPDGKMPPMGKAFAFTSAAVVFPMITESGSSLARPGDSGGRLTLSDRMVDDAPTILSDYPCGTKLGKWELRDWAVGEEVGLDVRIVTTCYKTRFDDAAALKL